MSVSYPSAPAKHITLIEIDLEVSNYEWINYGAGVWIYSPDVTYPAAIDPSLYTHLTGRDDVTSIGSVRVDLAPLTNAGSIALCASSNGTFFWDSANRLLYVHLLDENDPILYSVFIGLTQGFIAGNSSLSPEGENVYNSVLFDGRILSMPSVSRQKDSAFFGIQKSGGTGIVLANYDGYFDPWLTNYNLYGNEIRILIGKDSDAYADFTRVFTGFIESASIDKSQFSISIGDRRKLLETKIPGNSFLAVNFPYLATGNEGKPIPVIYGNVLDAPCICVNDTQFTLPTGTKPTGNYRFKFADQTIGACYAVNAVYNKKLNKAVTPISVDLDACEFTLDPDDYLVIDSGGDYSGPGEITADISGYVDSTGALINNALDIIASILNSVYSFDYSTVYYDVTEWNISEAAAPDIGLFVDKPKEIEKIISEIAQSVPGIFYIRGDGRFSFKTYDADRRPVSDLIYADELHGNFSSEFNFTEGITSVRVGYAQKIKDDTMAFIIDESQESTLVESVKVLRKREFETLIDNSTDASAYGTAMLTVYGGVFGRVSITTNFSRTYLDVMDFIVAFIDRENATVYGEKLYEVENISLDLDNHLVNLTMRLIGNNPYEIRITEGGSIRVIESADDYRVTG